MSNIRSVIAMKGRTVHTVLPSNTVFEAVCKMVQHNLGALVVVDQTGIVRGILSERDYLRKVAVEGRSSRTTFVQEIMTEDVICISPETDADACLKLMAKHRIRHLPVMDGSELMGVLSVRDLVDHLASEKEQTIQELTHYIQGGYA